MSDRLPSGASLALLTIDETRAGLQSGNWSVVDVVEASLGQIDAYAEPTGAFIRVHAEEALAHAEELDRDLSRGIVRGPLHGIPIALKDIFDIEGYPNSCGTGHRRAAIPPESTAPSVQALIDAGAVVVGQTNLHEWAFGATSSNPHFGPVINPWGGRCEAGGSSGGSAVAVAMGMSHVALGTDTGGSVRIPASLTGTAALKVTLGAISTAGVHPLSWTLDSVGPMARSPKDLVIPFTIMAMTGTASPLIDLPKDRPLVGTRLGIDRSYFLEPSLMEPAVHRTFLQALDQLVALGVDVVDVSIPLLQEASAARYAIILAEASAVHSGPRQADRSSYGEDIQQYLAMGDVMPAQDYIAGLRFRTSLWLQFEHALDLVDFLVSPATPVVAPPMGKLDYTWPDGSEESFLTASSRYVFPSNLAGVPSTCQPCGLTDDGLPVGLQLIGSPGSELPLLHLASALEDACGWKYPPPRVAHRPN